jgi:hypothetical protein
MSSSTRSCVIILNPFKKKEEEQEGKLMLSFAYGLTVMGVKSGAGG